ncbi:ribosomal-protein-alanine N-acetyltransferase [Kytococcus aerolatus]|uniref:Ribosomal-protein-alanine N-acetyltransferase n=1 Tax=Kytococcus aerolatus TaxID=592308 RepID=A0A212TZG9_9MICO|nr:ribosomal protein S18-alanine N-acetyltransferase [Kytococcus aerolatus]SNC71281.1 ribosomal-protein-alanine N-acetyltransferase [Kytococcus aerolatus]
MTVGTRSAHWRDLPRLAALERQAHPLDAWSDTAWWAELASPRREYRVAVPDAGAPPGGDLLGYAGLDHGGSTADVMTITVAPEARGQGLGRRLLQELVAAARAGGAEALLLEVRADNAPALALYDRVGFDHLSTRRDYYRGEDGPVDAHILRLLLPAGPAPTPDEKAAEVAR